MMMDIGHEPPLDPPEAEEAEAAIYCDECGEPIYEGEDYYEIREVVYCERCIEDMRVTA